MLLNVFLLTTLFFPFGIVHYVPLVLHPFEKLAELFVGETAFLLVCSYAKHLSTTRTKEKSFILPVTCPTSRKLRPMAHGRQHSNLLKHQFAGLFVALSLRSNVMSWVVVVVALEFHSRTSLFVVVGRRHHHHHHINMNGC
jgi:hypothetical protein